MKNNITTIITAVSSCLATLSFLAIFSPSTLVSKNIDPNSHEIFTKGKDIKKINLTPLEEELLYNKTSSMASIHDPTLGQITMFAGNFAPRGWALCDGQILPISSNEALFSIIGTIYGGDGRTTFALPDLRGRVPVHAGRGTGLTERRLGATGGAELTTRSSTTSVAGPGRSGNVNTGVVVGTGAENNMPPFQAINYIIALQGVFPSRS